MFCSAKRLFPPTTSVVLFLTAWQLVSTAGFVHASLFPPPSAVARAFKEMALSGELVRDLQASIWRAVVGFALGSLCGISAGLTTGRLTIVNGYLAPLLQMFRPLPPVAIIPLVIVWFGIGETSKLFSIAFAVFFPVWMNSHLGARAIPSTFLWSARSLGVGGISAFWRVIFPASLPFIAAGLRTGIALAFIMVFVSELAGASAGIGYQISVSHLAYRVDRMIAALALLGLFGSLADVILTRALRLLFPWLRFLAQK